jgi:hypothetical protein
MSHTARPADIRWLPAPLRALPALLVLAVVGFAPVSQAASRTELYQASVTMTERGDRAQAEAFAQALRVVLVRVTGRRTAGEDGALAPLVAEARRYVQQYRVAADNQLVVSFDGNAIDRWLAQNGQPIWGRDRPATFVWLAAPAAGTQAAGIVRAEDTSDLKAAIDAEALLRGVPLRWPAAADLVAHHIDYAAVAGGPPGPLFELGRQLGGEGVLVGRPGIAGTIAWSYQFQERAASFAGPTEGVDGAADVYAGLFAASGAPAAIDLEVSGLVDVAAYARMQAALESLSFVSHVSVRALDGDRAQLRLSVRGGAAALQRALALHGVLEPVAGGDGTALHYQLRP